MLLTCASGIVVQAKLAEELRVQDGQFVRANGTAIEGALAKGVTVSKYQNRAGAIDWGQAASDGVTFAMVRLGYLNDLDPYFAENMNGAAASGIRTGVFFYTQAVDEEMARAEARFVLDQIKDYPVSYPVAYDVESQHLLDIGRTRQDITNQVNAFCQVIADAGYRPIVYANHEWLTRHMDTAQIPYDIWYSRYETSVNAYQNRTIWQYTDAGTVAGIPGEVCIEIAFVDYSGLFPGTGWRRINDQSYYYVNYQKQTGWLQQEDVWYYLKADGVMAAAETCVVDGVSYEFDEMGRWVQ
ncbi:MAG: GH25 family lysozyme [Lachnospiraceae bacterium]|nr:GH25 family lysozyme [Lachnospiraceae bacterium]